MTATHANPLIVDHLTGRPCLDLERFAIGTIVDADTTAQTVTARYEGSPVAGSFDEHHPLPRPGERVTVTTGTGVAHGHWVAAHANAADRTLSVDLLTEQGMQHLRCGGRDFIVTSTHVPDPVVYAALAEGVQAARSRELWMEQLVEDAHVYADRNSLCGAFDEFMEEHGLPTRTRSYTVRVAVTSTVLIPVTARSEGDAEEQVDRDEVRAYLDLDEIVWSVERADLTD